MNEQPTADEHEFLGDEAAAAGQPEQALGLYARARRLHCDAMRLAISSESFDMQAHAPTNASLKRLNGKIRTLADELHPPRTLAERIADMRAEMDGHLTSGRLDLASHLSVQLGAAYEGIGDNDEAEAAYRYAVVLARQVDARDPELLLHTFWSLIDFLPPSEESVALAREMASNLLERKEMYHPMRAADAAYRLAIAELDFAEIAPHHMDSALDGSTRQAVEMLDSVCLHDKSQELQRWAAAVLRAVGRGADADAWRAAADRYEDWEWFTDQQIPGHVHLWDIRY
ncbi:hypothetical protein [Mycolicibacterium phocaicum]|uniref:hypothetical protein n=1 Tax=Mycolicibacterium phocaicum TaxID=319706 RepID=UPI001CF97637|nr:hypothetical protein [Mycolicibacterium phocaicum]UCZ62875.1 hypothetical protein LHJ73_12215 [Mycolicibacterium phocaicum]